MSHHGSSACTVDYASAEWHAYPKRVSRLWVVDSKRTPTVIETVTTNRSDLGDEFSYHVAKWVRETAHLSSPTKQVSHPSYLRIVGMGTEALPLILRELQHRARYWFAALSAITGEQPVKESDFGNVRAMRDTWLQWGRERGYLD